MQEKKDKELPKVDAVMGRPFKSALSASALDTIQHGSLRTVYRGIPFTKDPLDIGLYLQLISRLLPRSVIEIGTKFGGSALFFADMMTAHGVEGRVISIDIDPLVSASDPRISFLDGDVRSVGDPMVTFSDPRITFLEGDALSLERVLPPRELRSLQRPLLVVEDSSHRYETSTAVLKFFDDWLTSGDYIVIEDGILSQFSSANYDVYEDGPNRAVADFLTRNPDRYDIDQELCDHYGHNVTFNPNGWLRRR